MTGVALWWPSCVRDSCLCASYQELVAGLSILYKGIENIPASVGFMYALYTKFAGIKCVYTVEMRCVVGINHSKTLEFTRD